MPPPPVTTARKFAVMTTTRYSDRLEDWISGAQQDSLAHSQTSARNLRPGFEVVRNGSSLPDISSAVDGNITDSRC
jgi:hypothetical protein